MFAFARKAMVLPLRIRPCATGEILLFGAPALSWLRRAVAVAAVIILYPRLVAEDSASVPHGFLVVLLMGMSAAWVHGFGFVPENRILRVLFSPIVAWPVMIFGTWGVFLR